MNNRSAKLRTGFLVDIYSPQNFDLSFTENYIPPDAKDVSARLRNAKSPRWSQRRSETPTPPVEHIGGSILSDEPVNVTNPPMTHVETSRSSQEPVESRLEYIRSEALELREKISKLVGEDAAEDIRQSIDSADYWRIEANHYADCTRLNDVSPQEARLSISNNYYWLQEGEAYEFYKGAAIRRHAKEKQKLKMAEEGQLTTVEKSIEKPKKHTAKKKMKKTKTERQTGNSNLASSSSNEVPRRSERIRRKLK